MRNQFVGDIGDYAKYALLRALGQDRDLGVAWYLRPDVQGDRAGKFTGYLHQPRLWEHFDPDLFWRLRHLVCRGFRSVAAIESSGLLPPGTRYASGILGPRPYMPGNSDEWRNQWFDQVVETLHGCNFVFADPDNGLNDAAGWNNLSIAEAHRLAQFGPTIIYHHMRQGVNHAADIQHWMGRLNGCNHAFLCRRESARTFFVLNADDPMMAVLDGFVGRWRDAERRAGFKQGDLSRLWP